MAKRKPKKKRERSSHEPEKDLHEGIEESEELKAARAAIAAAQAELEKAQVYYRQLRETARRQIDELRKGGMGEVVDQTLKVTRKHPGKGLVVSFFLGVFLGRLFRR